MEITNVCPYCGGEMREGALPAYKYPLDKTLGSLGDRIDRAAERRGEEKAAREREEKRNKDPWEV